MSNDQTAARHSALAAALQSHGQGCPASDVLISAAAFLGFLTDTETKIEAAPAAKPAVKPVPPAKVIPVTGTKATTKAAAADEGVAAALEVIEHYGGFDGEHHKAWVIDQVARVLTGDRYAQWVIDMKGGEDGANTYGWDEGIPP